MMQTACCAHMRGRQQSMMTSSPLRTHSHVHRSSKLCPQRSSGGSVLIMLSQTCGRCNPLEYSSMGIAAPLMRSDSPSARLFYIVSALACLSLL